MKDLLCIVLMCSGSEFCLNEKQNMEINKKLASFFDLIIEQSEV